MKMETKNLTMKIVMDYLVDNDLISVVGENT